MMASDARLRELVPDPPGGLVGIDEAISRSLSSDRPRPVNDLADPHHLADTDPSWAGGDALRIRQLASAGHAAHRAAGTSVCSGWCRAPSRRRCAPDSTR